MTTKSTLAWIAVVVPMLVSATQARAQDDLDLAVSAIPPNLMLLVDNSGSMAHAMWHQDFDPGPFHDGAAVLANCNIGAVPAVAGSDGLCPLSGDASGRCPDNGEALDSGGGGDTIDCLQTAIPAGCAAAPAGWTCKSVGLNYRFTLPDHTPQAANTLWSVNYLSWLFTEILAGSTPGIPATDRMEIMKTVLLDVVDDINPDGFNDNVLFGLATFSAGADPDGGSIKTPISSGNKNALITKIAALQPQGSTPLAESLIDVAEYLTGDNDLARCTKSGTPGNGPMDDWCRKNFVIVLTDGEPTKDDFDHGATGKSEFICEIGNADGDTNEIADEYSGRTDVPPYQDLGTDWLDDVSYYLYENDLRLDFPDLQNIVTYAVGFTIDHPLLSETAVNSTGEYFVADNASELSQAVHDAIIAIIERSTSFTAATVPASRTSFSDGLYAAWFIPRLDDPTWEGHLEAYTLSATLGVLDKNGGAALDAFGEFVEPRQPFWDLGLRLLDPAHPARTIYTTLAGARSSFDAATIDAATLGVLAGEVTAYPNDPNVPFADEEAVTDAIVDYMHGLDAFDDDRDTVTSETRDWVLGDIFHSRPVAIGPPPTALSFEEGFGPATSAGTFLQLFGQRDRRLYVGANDGMLHAVEGGSFQAGDNPLTAETENGYYDMGSGNEVFAYVPGVLLDTIKFVPRNGIPRGYYYVDGSPTAADAWFPSFAGDTDKQGSEWTTVLVTGMRQGGPGYVALDVTDPGAVVAGTHGPYPKLLWEFDDPNEPAGESWSRPILTRVKVAGAGGSGDHCGPDDGDGDCREQWVAIIGGGFLANGDPNLGGYVADPNDAAWSEDSKAVFIIALDTGAVLAKLARDPADPQLQKMLYAIPSTPAVLDLDFDGFADLIYIGDTGGQLWKWDLSEVGRDTDIDGLVDAASWPAGVFFESVVSDTARYRSLFFPPSASFIEGELTLAFGTGERSDLGFIGDNGKDENNRFYVVRDPQPTGPASVPATPYTEANLSDITSLPTVPVATNLGFYFVVQDGEKFVSNHLIFAGFAITTSYLADDSGDVCNAQGEGFIYIFDLLSGSGGFDPADGATSQGRALSIGTGVPMDPQISTSSDGTGSLFVKTSSGAIMEFAAPDDGSSPVELVYWKQDF